MQEEKRVAELINAIAHKREHGLRFPFMSGKVTQADEGEMTVGVKLSVDMTLDGNGNAADGFETGGINLNVTINNTGGVYMIPADGADCIVAEIDGPGKWELIKASAYKKVVVQADTLVQFNAGGNGGLTITPELKKQLDKNNALLAHLIGIIKGAPIPEPGSGSASALQAALKGAIIADVLGDFSNIENKKVKH